MKYLKSIITALPVVFGMGSSAMAQEESIFVKDADNNGVSDVYEKSISECSVRDDGAGQIKLNNGDVVVNTAWEQVQMPSVKHLELEASDGELILCSIDGDEERNMPVPSVEPGQFEFMDGFDEMCVSFNGIWVDVYSTETGEIIEVTAPITSVFQTVTDMNELKMADVEGICSHEQEFEGIRGELETRRVTGPIVSVEYFDATP